MACFIWRYWQRYLENIVCDEGNKHKFWRVYYWLGAGVVYSFLFMTIGRTAWMVSFVLGLIFLGFYQSEKRKSSISEMVCCWYCVYV